MAAKKAKKRPGASAITTEAMDALIKFLPIFEKRGFVFGRWSGGECDDSDTVTMPMFSMSADARRFLEALYDNNWIVPFDWPKWQAKAARYCESPEKLKGAKVETLRRLLTLHVRKERFCEGHMAAVHKSGHLVAILRRLKEIRQGRA